LNWVDTEKSRLKQGCALNKVETEIHFLLECPKYQNLRNYFNKKRSENICKNYWQLSHGRGVMIQLVWE
jgi:hypothetical protein